MDLHVSFDVWLRQNISQNKHNGAKVEWNILFSNTIWWMWKWRNDAVFKNKQTDIEIKVRKIKEQAYEIKRAFNSRSAIGGDNIQSARRWLRWIPPPMGWIALNVDGCLKQNHTKARGGGILRTEPGKWVLGFTGNIGSCTVEEAELWAVCDGLEITWKLRFSKVRLEVDSQIVVKLIKFEEVAYLRILNLLDKCHNLLSKDWKVQVQHIYREQNMTADYLASEALKER